MPRLRGFLRTSFLERNQRLIGVIGVVGLLGASAFALLLSGGVFARTYHVKAYFTDAAGVVPGDKVTVAGLNAGTVRGVDIENGVVALDLAVTSGVELPKDSSADIVIQTLLGKRVVDLKSGHSKAMLAGGDTIPVDRTSTPVDITELNDISVRLLNESDAQAFNKLLDEVSAVTSGERDQVSELIDGLNKVLAAVDSRKEQLSGLIDAFKSLSTTLADKDTTILSMIDRLNIVLGNLAAHQADLKALLVATDSASHETADLVLRNRSTLDSTLANLHDTLKVLADHQLDLAATIDYVHQAVQGYASVGYSCVGVRTAQSCSGEEFDNRWASIFVQSLGPLGVDTLLDQCGVIDAIIDQMLGTDCKTSGGSGLLGGGSSNGGNAGGEQGGGKPHPLPSLPVPTPSLGLGGAGQDLPGDVGDLVDSVLQGIGGKRQ